MAAGAPAVATAASPVTTAGAFTPASLATGFLPAGLSSNLFSANSYNPGLLLGSPVQGAAANLFNPRSNSAVSTVSQAQALASDDGDGYGTPVTIGVIILACLIAFAVRHRIVSRMKSRELPAGPESDAQAVPGPRDPSEAASETATTEAVPGGPQHRRGRSARDRMLTPSS